MEKIKIAIIGVGNCTSSLLQGIEYYRHKDSREAIGLMHWDIGGYKPFDIDVVAAFDIDKRKVGKDINEAIFALPNNANVFCGDLPISGVKVQMGKILDGFSEHMKNYDEKQTYILSNENEASKDIIVSALVKSGAEILLNHLPAGSVQATRFYAECALESRVSFINNTSVFIASDPTWAAKFKRSNIPVIGDDIKSQLETSIIHRILASFFRKRGVEIERTYQLNTGGNTNFLNMLYKNRFALKKELKTEAVQSILNMNRLEDKNIHIGPSDYVPWQKDNKICFIRIEGRLFGDASMSLELRLSVEDSPNSAGVSIDVIRCCKIALNRGKSGGLYPLSAYFMRHPPKQFPDDLAYRMTEEFIAGQDILSDDLDRIEVDVRIPQKVISSKDIDRLLDAINNFMESCGFEYEAEFEVTKGSFYQKLRFLSKNQKTRDEMEEIYKKGKRALELQYLDKPTAEATNELTNAASNLINACNSLDEVVIRLGAILLVKVNIDGKSKLVVDTVSPDVIIKLESDTSLYNNPLKVYELLRSR